MENNRDKKYFKLIPSSLEINTFEGLRGNIVGIKSDIDSTGRTEYTDIDLEEYANILRHMSIDKILEACNKNFNMDDAGIGKVGIQEWIKNKTKESILEIQRSNSIDNICNNLAMLSNKELSVRIKGIGYAKVDSIEGSRLWIYEGMIHEIRSVSRIMKEVKKIAIECIEGKDEIRIPEVNDSFYAKCIDIHVISDIEENRVPEVIDINNVISDKGTTSVKVIVHEAERVIANTNVGNIAHFGMGCIRSRHAGGYKMKEIDLTNRSLEPKRIMQGNECEHIIMNKCRFKDQLEFAQTVIEVRANKVEVVGCRTEAIVDDTHASEYLEEYDGVDKDIVIDNEGYRKIGKYLEQVGFKKMSMEDYTRMLNNIHKLGLERPEGLRNITVIKVE